MAGEWKFGTWAWTPVAAGGTDNSQTILTKLQAFLALCGWSTAAYSTTDTKYMIRTDHGSNDTWHYTGDTNLQRCGIRLRNQNYNGGAFNGVARVDVSAFLETSAGTAVERAGHANSEIRIDYDTAAINDYLLVGGEDGFYVEAYTRGQEVRNVGCGLVSVFKPWTVMKSTRDAERKWTSQGLAMDFRGTVAVVGPGTGWIDRLTLDRNFRLVCNDGLNSNKTAGLAAYSVRSVTNIITGTGQSYDNRHRFFPLDNMLGLVGTDGTSNHITTDSILRYPCSFGLLNTPSDDRWRLSPFLVMQAVHNFAFGLYNTGTSNNNDGPQVSGVSWSDPRWWRQIQRIMACGHQIPPWQLVTDSVSGKQYRIVGIPDNGRPANVALEWPGAANEVTIP